MCIYLLYLLVVNIIYHSCIIFNKLAQTKHLYNFIFIYIEITLQTIVSLQFLELNILYFWVIFFSAAYESFSHSYGDFMDNT